MLDLVGSCWASWSKLARRSCYTPLTGALELKLAVYYSTSPPMPTAIIDNPVSPELLGKDTGPNPYGQTLIRSTAHCPGPCDTCG